MELSNLHRQVVHDEESVGIAKVDSAVRHLSKLNSTVDFSSSKTEAVSCDNILSLIRHHDVVIDATDNPEARYTINDACILLKKPLVSGSAGRCLLTKSIRI